MTNTHTPQDTARALTDEILSDLGMQAAMVTTHCYAEVMGVRARADLVGRAGQDRAIATCVRLITWHKMRLATIVEVDGVEVAQTRRVDIAGDPS